jgi:hypothetical protein
MRSLNRGPTAASRRNLPRLLVVLAAAVAYGTVAATAAHAGTMVNRSATINPDPAVYEWITPNLYATSAGENVYIRFDRTPESLYVRWVKCGYTSTQDGASSVGGQAKFVAKDSNFGGAIGTNFVNGSCVRLWARSAKKLNYRPSYPIEAYFDDHYHL